jgi:thiamine pyrophosphokinase
VVTRALILAGGAGPRRTELDAAWPGWAEDVSLVIGADAGALLAQPLGLSLDLIVGDGDSLGPAALSGFEASGIAVERAPTDKDASDLELGLAAARQRGATELIVVGAFGARIDHFLANVWLLAWPGLAEPGLTLLDGRTRVRLLTGRGRGRPDGRLELTERPGDLVTLLPFSGPAEGVTTHGLRWPLAGATLPLGSSLGLSNEVLGGAALRPWVELERGRLLIIETSLLGSPDEHA